MKGVVFTEFLDYCEAQFSMETVDNIIQKSNVPSHGVYCAVGAYDPAEMFALVDALSEEVNIPVDALLKLYGKYLFTVFHKNYPQFFSESTTTFTFLQSVESYIHVEVKKLYPDAELPHFDFETTGPDNLTLIYNSKRKLGDLAEGLIMGCAEHHKEKIEIKRTDVHVEEGARVRFEMTKI